jgi:hypothetical protein
MLLLDGWQHGKHGAYVSSLLLPWPAGWGTSWVLQILAELTGAQNRQGTARRLTNRNSRRCSLSMPLHQAFMRPLYFLNSLRSVACCTLS